MTGRGENEPLLEVRDLRVAFPRDDGPVHPVDGVSFRVFPGETIALVGESGSGTSLTGLVLLRLVPHPGEIATGSAIRIGFVFQDPNTSVNPVLSA